MQNEQTKTMNEPNDLLSLQLLIDEIRNEDIQVRLNSMRNLAIIAKALGPERAKNELIGFITSDCLDDEDEVLLVLSEQLALFPPYLGSEDNYSVLLKPLEILCQVEESSVREKSVQSINSILALLPQASTYKLILPLITRLSSGEWFTSRASSCGLFPLAFATSPALSDTLHLLSVFNNLSSDEMPMVRRSSGSSLASIIPHFSQGDSNNNNSNNNNSYSLLHSHVLPIFLSLSKDDQDSVRLLIIPCCVSLSKLFNANNNNGNKECREHVLPIIKNCGKDESWRVRYMLADNFIDLVNSMGADITVSELIPIYVSLLQDSESEVRTAASFKVAGVSALIPLDLAISKILPCLKDLCADGSKHARAALASVIMGLAPIYGSDKTIQHLLPLFVILLKDDFPEVRLNVIGKLAQVNKVLGVEKLSASLLPAIVDLAEDRQWRVRLAIIEYIPLLAQQLGVEFFDDKLGNLCMTWLGDSVYSIREAATKNLRELTKVFGVEWAEVHIIPRVLGLYTHPNYLYRMTTLFAIAALSETVGPEVVQKSMLPLVMKMADDPVPNIRFNVAKTMGVMIMVLRDGGITPELRDKVKAVLGRLYEDKDRDVKFYAAQAMNKLGATVQ